MEIKRFSELSEEELRKINYDKAPSFYEKQGFKYIKDVLKNDESGYGRLYSIDIKENQYDKYQRK